MSLFLWCCLWYLVAAFVLWCYMAMYWMWWDDHDDDDDDDDDDDEVIMMLWFDMVIYKMIYVYNIVRWMTVLDTFFLFFKIWRETSHRSVVYRVIAASVPDVRHISIPDGFWFRKRWKKSWANTWRIRRTACWNSAGWAIKIESGKDA